MKVFYRDGTDETFACKSWAVGSDQVLRLYRTEAAHAWSDQDRTPIALIPLGAIKKMEPTP